MNDQTDLVFLVMHLIGQWIIYPLISSSNQVPTLSGPINQTTIIVFPPRFGLSFCFKHRFYAALISLLEFAT